MTTVFQDLGNALRALGRQPGFTLAVVATLGLGIGANTAMFSVVHGVLLRPLPYPNEDQLFAVWYANPDRGRLFAPFSKPNFEDIQRQTQTVRSLAAYPAFSFSGMVLTGAGEPRELATGYVSAEFFTTLGVSALAGRGFRIGEDQEGTDEVVVLSERFWRERFAADSNVSGRTINLDGTAFTVVGVMPSSLQLPSPEVEVWVPLSRITPNRIPHFIREIFWLNVIARTPDTVSVERVGDELSTLASGLAQAYPDDNEGWTRVNVVPLRDRLVGDTRPALLLLLGAVTLVLLVVCANVANLMLARATTRARELALRSALGATRGRIVAQAVAEGLVMGVGGGVVGVGLAALSVQAFIAMGAEQIPRAESILVDGPVLLFAAVLAVLTGVLFGVAPAGGGTRTDLSRALNDAARGTSAGRSRFRARHALVTAQMAVAVTLVIGAGLLFKSLRRMTTVDPGFAAENLLTVSFTFPSFIYRVSGSYTDAYARVLEAVRNVPGVVSAGAVQQMPAIGFDESTGFDVPGRTTADEEDDYTALVRTISSQYFDTMRIPILRGRAIDERDTGDAPRTIVVNRALADAIWPTADPVGQQLDVWDGPAEVVGVVGNVRHGGFTLEPRPTIYVSNAQITRSRVVLMIRTAADPRTVADAVRGAIWSVDPDQPIRRIAPMSEVLGATVTTPRFTTALLGAFATLGVIVAATGVFAVVSYTVSQRTHEMGIRMTLGADRFRILRLVLRQVIGTAAVGSVIGAGLALVFGRFLAGMLFEVSRADPSLYVVVPTALVLVAVAASYVPARRATRVDPMTVLRVTGDG